MISYIAQEGSDCIVQLGGVVRTVKGCEVMKLANTIWDKPGRKCTGEEMKEFGFGLKEEEKMRWTVKGKYVVEAETEEEARKAGNKQFGHVMEIVSIEEELLRKASLKPVNMPMEIGEEGKDLIRSVCGMRDRDMRSARCILSKLETWQLVNGDFPEIEEARLKALQIAVNALERGRPNE